MPRALRIWFPGAVYHIIQRGNNQQDIFHEERDYLWFLRTVAEIKREKTFKVYCYALMGNHYHLTIEATGSHISDIMHAINSTYAIRFNKKYQRTGHLFQGRFQGILVDSDSYLLELSRYIHLNPVKAGFVEKPENYPWSSYKVYVGSTKDALINPELILEHFQMKSDKGHQSHKKYKDFVYEKLRRIREEQDWLKAHLRRQRFLGDKGFLKRVLQKGA